MRRTILLCCFGLLFGASLFAQAPAVGEAHEAALRLVRTMNLRPQLEEAILKSMPAGESREIGRLLFADDKSFLEVYEGEAAALYEKRFSAQEMRGLADFFAGDLGRKWAASQPELAREQSSLLHSGQGSLLMVAEVGCEAALLGPNFVAAREKAGKPDMAVPDDFVTRYAPVVKGVRGLCNCLLKEAVKRWGPGAMAHPQEEFAALTQELVKSGACPLPNMAAPAPPKP